MTDVPSSAVASSPVVANGHDLALIARAREMIEGTVLSQAKIAAELGLDANVLSALKRAEGWVRPAGAPRAPKFATAGVDSLRGGSETKAEARRRHLVERLYRLASAQIRQIEKRLKEDKETDEKDARVLGTLARTLDTLMALERDNGTTAERPEPVNRDALNAELARRVARWAAGGEGPG